MKLLYRLVYNLAIYGIVLHKANCFKSEFNYVDQIFLNTSEWIFETTFDHEKFSQVVDSSQEDCVKIIDELDLNSDGRIHHIELLLYLDSSKTFWTGPVTNFHG